MTERKPDETLEQYAIRTVYEHGGFWNPDTPDGWNIRQSDLAKLKATDPVVVQAFISYAKANVVKYTEATLDVHGRRPMFDGTLGPAMEKMILDPEGRCPIPDYAPPRGVVFSFDDPAIQEVVTTMQSDNGMPSLGTGNWPSCHNVGKYHCATVRVNPSGLPSFLQPLFVQVLTRVQKAYADVGLLFRFLNMNKVDILNGEELDTNINIEMSFVNSSSGWIGLAIVGNSQTCQSNIWCRFLATYKGGSSNESIITQWTTLIKHELGHNCGRSHTSGGVMNPSLVTGLPAEWTASDPTTSWLKSQFGGTPVPIPGDNGPDPGPNPDPPDPMPDWKIVAKELQLKNVVQDVQIQWLTEAVRKLREGR